MFIIEGNIGAGKSTFLRLIAENLKEATVALEPLQDWQKSFNGVNILDNFYSDPKRWAYTLETLTLMSRVKEHIKEQGSSNRFHLVERSIYSGHYCFAKNCYETGLLSDLEYKIYLEFFNLLILKRCQPPKGFIYLKVSPEVAIERIKKRNRSSESLIPISYIEQIDQKHEEFLIKKLGVIEDLKSVPVLVINCDQEFENNGPRLKSICEEVYNFMSNII